MLKATRENPILSKSYAFALRIIRAYCFLIKKKEFVLSKQLLKSGTSIGANVKEGVSAQSKKEFISKLNTSLKEAKESEYWIMLLRDSAFFTKAQAGSLLKDLDELISLLTAIIKTTNKRIHSTF